MKSLFLRLPCTEQVQRGKRSSLVPTWPVLLYKAWMLVSEEYCNEILPTRDLVPNDKWRGKWIDIPSPCMDSLI